MLRLELLTPEEIFVLLQRIREIHALHYLYTSTVTDKQIEFFLNEIRKRLGTEQLLTPREIVRDFIAVLNIIQQNPGISFDSIVASKDFRPSQVERDPEALTAETEIVDEDDSIASPYKSFEL
jgi:hypothetical protein